MTPQWYWQTGCNKHYWDTAPFMVRDRTATVEGPYGPWLCTVVIIKYFNKCKGRWDFLRTGIRIELAGTRQEEAGVWQIPGRTLFVARKTGLVNERPPWDFARTKTQDYYRDTNGRPVDMLPPRYPDKHEAVDPERHRWAPYIDVACEAANEALYATRCGW